MANPTLFIVMVLTAGLGAAHAVRAGEVWDYDVGYTLRVPDGWAKVPDDVLHQMRAGITKPGAAGPNFIAAYEPVGHGDPFTYPYLLIQQHAYPHAAPLCLERIARGVRCGGLP